MSIHSYIKFLKITALCMIFLFPFTNKQIHTHYNYKHVSLLSRYDDQPFLFFIYSKDKMIGLVKNTC